MMKDGDSIDNVTVNGDMQIKAVYTPETGEAVDSNSESAGSKESGCSGNVNGGLATMLLGLSVSALVVGKLSKKRGKEDA